MSFFELSKIGWFLVTPSNGLIIAGVIGVLALLLGWRRLAAPCLVVAGLGLGTFGCTPASTWLLASLEDRFPRFDAAGRTVHGIIVLGGAVEPSLSRALDQLALNDAAERMTAAVALARRFPEARIVFTGGTADLLQNLPPEADFARRLFEDLGLGPGRVAYEGASRNTIENATLSRTLIAQRPGETWLLLTSAFHMPRSMGVFRRYGYAVEAYPVDFRTERRETGFLIPGSIASALVRADVALREYLGLVAYRIAGHTDALFPAP